MNGKGPLPCCELPVKESMKQRPEWQQPLVAESISSQESVGKGDWFLPTTGDLGKGHQTSDEIKAQENTSISAWEDAEQRTHAQTSDAEKLWDDKCVLV